MTRPTNADLRTREFLTEDEVKRLVKAVEEGARYPLRDSTMLLLAYRHGFRASELCDLRWNQIDFKQAVLHVSRIKNGSPSTHPLTGDELRRLRKLRRENEGAEFVFVNERKTPFARSGFARIVERAAARAKLEIKAHAHMLRHATGYALANRGIDTRTVQAYLGHKNINHTVRYTELAPNRFKDIWK